MLRVSILHPRVALPLLIALVAAQPATAQTTIDRQGSVLLFPALVGVSSNEGPFDQLVSIANVANDTVYARCFYLFDVDCAVAADFNLTLTRQQPTQWSVRRGRPVDTTNPICSAGNNACADAGLDPGPIPEMPEFAGGLLCIETDALGEPLGGNHLVGSLTQNGPLAGDSGHYEAIRLRATETFDGDNVLCIGEQSSPSCPNGAELEACPQSWFLVHDAAIGDALTSPREGNSVFLLPCRLDLTAANPQGLFVRISVYNEFEQLFTKQTTTDCVGELNLTDLFSAETLGTASLQTELRRLNPGAGFIAVASRDRFVSGSGTWRAIEFSNLHHRGVTADSTDQIQLPPAVEVLP